jgi:hypothetical protein
MLPWADSRDQSGMVKSARVTLVVRYCLAFSDTSEYTRCGDFLSAVQTSASYGSCTDPPFDWDTFAVQWYADGQPMEACGR